MLLEALISILIFSLGILGIVKLQAVSVQQSSTANYRVIASLMANDVISQMWGSNKNTLKTDFESGQPYSAWVAKVVASGLPNVSQQTNKPTIVINTVAAGGTDPSNLSSNQAVVTVFWQAPYDTSVQKFTAVAQIK